MQSGFSRTVIQYMDVEEIRDVLFKLTTSMSIVII